MGLRVEKTESGNCCYAQVNYFTRSGDYGVAVIPWNIYCDIIRQAIFYGKDAEKALGVDLELGEHINVG